MKKLFVLIIAITTAMAGFAQTASTQKAKAKKHTTTTVKYVCPMHPDMVMDKPGKCTQCGMNLHATKKEQMKIEVMKLYSCPMHADVTSDKPGKCTKCNMDLTEVKTKKKTK